LRKKQEEEIDDRSVELRPPETFVPQEKPDKMDQLGHN
jgi:hypothetical protein